MVVSSCAGQVGLITQLVACGAANHWILGLIPDWCRVRGAYMFDITFNHPYLIAALVR